MTEIKWKRRLSYMSIGLFYFMGGVEYAVILPTIWLYIHTKFHAQEYFLGLLLSAYSLAAILSAPLLGRWSDKFRKPKILILVGTLVQVLGNFMYFMGLSEWFLLASRLVAGVGGGVEGVILAEVTRTSVEEKRTGIISILISIRQTGLLIGPGLNLFLRLLDFDIGSFHVDKYNAPGAFMSCLWLIQTFIVLFIYTDLHRLKESPKHVHKSHHHYGTTSDRTFGNSLPRTAARIDYDEDIYKQIGSPNNSTPKRTGSQASTPVHSSYSSSADSLIETAENVITNQSENINSPSHGATEFAIGDGSVAIETEGLVNGSLTYEEKLRSSSQEYIDSQEGSLNDYLQGKSKLRFMYHEYVREEIVALIAVNFNSYFNQTALETMVTPLSNKLLNWGELENSIMYCCAGVEIICVFLLVRWLSKRLEDRFLIMIGLLTLTVANGWLLYAVPDSKPNDSSRNLWRFILGCVLDMFALPFLVASSISLYSKITRKETQGLSMGLRRSVVGLATIFGPLWAGAAVPWPYVMFGVMTGLLVMSLCMMTASYTKLKPLSEMPLNQAGLITSSNTSLNRDETAPLLT